MRRSFAATLVPVVLLVFWLSRQHYGDGANEDAGELARLRYANELLQRRLRFLQLESKDNSETNNERDAAKKANKTGTHRGVAHDLLAAHRVWDWRGIATEFLRPFPTVSSKQLDAAVQACNGSAMYCQRFQVYKGRLYITDYAAIFFDRHYAPARVMPLLETLRRHPKLPDLDIVVAGNDEPRIHSVPGDERSWSRTCSRWPGRLSMLPPAIFSSTTNRITFDLPWRMCGPPHTRSRRLCALVSTISPAWPLSPRRA